MGNEPAASIDYQITVRKGKKKGKYAAKSHGELNNFL